jgi:hypothetical protein
LLWRVFLINAAMLAAATLALALSPATVSFPLALTEALVLGGGLASTLALDFTLLRRALSARPPSAAPMTASAAGMPGVSAPRLGRTTVGDGPAFDAGEPPRAVRLLVGWARPHHLSEEEAEGWARREMPPLLAAAGVARARLVRLSSASPRYHRPWDWLLELDVAPGGDVKQCVESPAWREWLGDLRLLGLGPAAMVAAHTRVVSAEKR